MLERIREGSQGITAKIILGLVILTFAISGIGSYINSASDTAVKTINGVEITQTELDQAFENERNRMKQQFGDIVDQLMADESYVANFKQGVLDRLVVEELQRQQATDLGIRVSDEQIKKTILEMSEFQRDGQFDNEVYLALLRQAGFQPSQFRDYLRTQMTRAQYSSSIMGSEFVLPHETKQYEALNNQVRSFSQLTVSSSALASEVSLTDDELAEYFENNQFSYKTQHKVAVEYIKLDAEELAAAVKMDDADLKSYYEQNLAEFATPEQRRIAHILVNAGAGAQAKINDIKAKLDAGQEFDALAKEFSEDTFSAENGGDLDWFEAGIFGDKFDTAVLSLKEKGELTDVFESEAGFHIVKMTDFVAGHQLGFDSVKERIAKQLKADKINELYIEAQTKVSQIAFEVPDSLKEAATDAGVELKKTALSSYAELQQILGSPIAASKAFDDEFIGEGLNSDLIELDDGKSIVLRVTENSPARQQELSEVKDAVVSALTSQKASELAMAKAEELAATAGSVTELESLASAPIVVASVHNEIGRVDTSVNASVRDAAFEMPKPQAGANEVETVELPNGDAVVIVLKSVSTKPAQVAAPQRNQLMSVVAQQATKALIEASKANADIKG
jgi:peptidyl-prolyl cis-trans isomerase D